VSQKSTAALRTWALASASRTASAGAVALKNTQGHKGLMVIIDVTTAGTGSVSAVIRAILADGTTKRVMLSTTAVVTATVQFSFLYPGTPETANIKVSMGLPVDYQVEIIHNNANAITYSAFAELIP